MQDFETLLYDIGKILKERRNLCINGIFDTNSESFLKKGIENTGGVMVPFQGYMHMYEDGTERNAYLFAVDAPAKYSEWVVKPRTNWKIIVDNKNYYRHITNPPEGVKVLVLRDLRHLKEYLVSELEEDRKRRERAVEKKIAPAIKILKKVKNNSAKRFYLEGPIKDFKKNPSQARFNEIEKQIKSVDRESIEVKWKR